MQLRGYVVSCVIEEEGENLNLMSALLHGLAGLQFQAGEMNARVAPAVMAKVLNILYLLPVGQQWQHS